MEITNGAADIINHYLDDVSESISSIEDAVQLNKEFNNQFNIGAYYNPYQYYKKHDGIIPENSLLNSDVYCLGETLYESILLWGFNYFKDKVQSYNLFLTYGYYDYLCGNDKGELQEAINCLTNEESIQLIDDPICNYFIHKFSLDIKI